jgi:hypothetical protein
VLRGNNRLEFCSEADKIVDTGKPMRVPELVIQPTQMLNPGVPANGCAGSESASY